MGTTSDRSVVRRGPGSKKQRREKIPRKFFEKMCERQQDVFQRMMLTSDPYISSFGNHLKQQRKSFSPEAMTMFLCSDGSLMDDDDASDLNDI